MVCAVCLVPPACAQVAPAPDAPPGMPVPQNGQTGSPEAKTSAAPVFEISTNLVNLFFVAYGPHDRLVPDLKRSDCSIDEDGVPQTIQSFHAETTLPLTLGILLDTSLSQERVLPTEKRAAAAFLHRILKPKDEAFLFSFDVDATMLSDFTGSAHNLERAIDGAHINSNSGNFANGTLPQVGRPKGTVLYDAVYLAANDKLRQESGRKALILLTDGDDEGSDKNLKAAIEAAQKADAVVYVLLIRDGGLLGIANDSGGGPMRKLALATGGEVFKIGNNGRKMQAAFDQIERELRTQYEASYKPTNEARDGTYRRIQVECRQNGQTLHVRARRGYYAQAPGR